MDTEEVIQFLQKFLLILMVLIAYDIFTNMELDVSVGFALRCILKIT